MKKYIALAFFSCLVIMAKSQDYIVLPTSPYAQVIDNQSAYIPINMTYEEYEEPAYSLDVGGKGTDLATLEKTIRGYIYGNKAKLNSSLPVMLRIDKAIAYEYVADLKEELKRLSLNTVIYQVENKDKTGYNMGIPAKLSIFYESVHAHYAAQKGIENKQQISFKHILEGMPEDKNPPKSPEFPAVTRGANAYRKYFVRLSNEGELFIDIDKVKEGWFFTALDKKIKESNKNGVIVRLETEKKVTFEQYLNTFAEIIKVLDGRNTTLVLADYSFIEMNFINDF